MLGKRVWEVDVKNGEESGFGVLGSLFSFLKCPVAAVLSRFDLENAPRKYLKFVFKFNLGANGAYYL